MRKSTRKGKPGDRFGVLVIINPYYGRRARTSAVQCRCDCGRVVVVLYNNLARGYTKSCGCRQHLRGPQSAHWKGGRRTTSQGYIVILEPDHPAANRDGYVFEHRLVMEKHLGRYLTPSEVVHHEDGDRANNDISNLRLFAYDAVHQKRHRELKRRSAERLSPAF